MRNKIILIATFLLQVFVINAQRSLPIGGTPGQIPQIKPDGINVKWTDQNVTGPLTYTASTNTFGISKAGEHSNGYVDSTTYKSLLGKQNTSPVYFANAATTSALAVTYSSGTITATSNGRLANQDGIKLTLFDKFLVKNNSSALQNGLYVIYDTGTVSSTFKAYRDSSYNETSEIYPSQINVLQGLINGGNYFLQTTVNPIVGADPIVYISTPAPTTVASFVTFVDVVLSTPLPNSPVYTSGSVPGMPGQNAIYKANPYGHFPTINGVPPFPGMRVLVIGQADSTKNGDYVLTDAGTSVCPFCWPWVLQRISYSSSMLYPHLWEVTRGTHKGEIYQQNNASLVNSTIGTSGNITFTKISPSQATSIKQTWKIYVDAQNGVDATNAGQIQNPYATVEYVLANVVNTGTLTATTTSSGYTITGVTTNSNIAIGEYITGTNVPYNTIITAFTSSTIVVSQPMTGSGTVTISWWIPYQLFLKGNFTATSSWAKSGFWVDAREAIVNFGAITLFNYSASSLIPEFIWLGNWYGTNTSSRLIGGTGTYAFQDLFLDYGNGTSLGTSYAIDKDGTGTALSAVNFYITGKMLNAKAGKVAILSATNNIDFSGNTYGLLAGLNLSSTITSKLSGFHQTPTNINVLTTSSYLNSTANLIGSTVWGYYCNHTGMLKGTIHEINGFCNIKATDRSSGTFIIQNGGTTSLELGQTDGITLTIASGTTCITYGIIALGDMTVNGTLINNAQIFGGNTTTTQTGTIINNGIIDFSTLARGFGLGANFNFKNYGYVKIGYFLSQASGYSVENYGTFSIANYGINLAHPGTFINKGTITTYGSLLGYQAGVIVINNASAVFRDYGTIEHNTNEDVSLIAKTTGSLYVYPNAYFKVSNSKSPIKCTANTSASKDVYIFGAVDNCDGSTYGIGYAYDGSSYAPNNLVTLPVPQIFENTNY